MMKFHAFGAAILGSLILGPQGAAFGQSVPEHYCTTHGLHHLEPLHQNDPVRLAEIETAEMALEAETQAFVADDAERGGNAYVLPVVFHIIHNNGPENISDEQVHDAMRVLNDDFNRLNPDWDNVNPAFLSLVADVGITFRLAQKDPNGNCTNGITRTQSVLTYDGTQTMKNLIQWPRNKYLNVWVAASADGAAGYTLTPGSVANSWAAAADGIVLLHNYTGSIGTSSPSRSRTLTHEVGHWINLRHTWGGTNEPALSSNCNSDDNVSDTPNTIGWTSCNLNGNTCGSLDNVENFMEYSYCSKMFTQGQSARMLAALNSSTAQRNQLWQPGNLLATGTDGTDILCAADFTSNARVVCAGDVVQFDDLSYNGVTSWDWDLPGAVPPNSNDENPSVTYTSAGQFTVGLTASDGNTTVSTTENDYIIVLPAPGLPTPFSDDLEVAQSIPNTDWLAEDLGGNSSFSLYSAAGFSGTKSIRLNNINAVEGEVDELTSTTIDLSNATSISLSFRYAFAKRNSGNNDVLRVYVSNDCGTNWSLRKQLYASNILTTAPDHPGTFVPNDPSEWGFTDITNINSAFHVNNFRMKFEFTSDGGNNLYLDDINVQAGPVGIHELITTDADGLSIIPNPVLDQADLLLDLRQAGRVSVEILDALGRSAGYMEQEMLAGEQRMRLPLDLVAPGMYSVVVRQNELRQTTRLIKR
ncbi:MAG: T9SS type A sorting domain-containing protein [Flavobacteriales bacterium]|nr:T9SS type A sorting domain-containing protein [Flavobacteriales bacterium]